MIYNVEAIILSYKRTKYFAIACELFTKNNEFKIIFEVPYEL